MFLRILLLLLLQAAYMRSVTSAVADLQAKQQYHRELGMLVKEAEFERSELIVEMAKVHEAVTQMKVCRARHRESWLAVSLKGVAQRQMTPLLTAPGLIWVVQTRTYEHLRIMRSIMQTQTQTRG